MIQDVSGGCSHRQAYLRLENSLPRWLTCIAIRMPQFFATWTFSIGEVAWSHCMAASFPQNQLSQRESKAEVVMFFMA